MWTKVLSKDEWMKLLLSMSRRGVVDYVVVTNRVRLLARPIVACWSHLMARCHGGARVERRRVVQTSVGLRWAMKQKNVMNNTLL